MTINKILPIKNLEQNRAFVKAMFDVVEEAGDQYVFSGVCQYFRGDEPACLIGRALSKLGMTASRFGEIRNSRGGDYNSTGAFTLLTVLGYDSLIAEAADKAQRIQDGRTTRCEKGTWGEALNAFLCQLHGTDFIPLLSKMD